MKKKLILMVLTIVVLSVVGYAATVQASVTDVKIMLDGKVLSLTDVNNNEVKPLIVDGTTYLPVRAIGENLGLEVDWNGETRTVILKSNGSSVSVDNGSTSVDIGNGQVIVDTNTGNQTTTPNTGNTDTSSGVKIVEVNDADDYIVIKNTSTKDVNLKDWKIVIGDADHTYVFSNYNLKAGATFKLDGDNFVSMVVSENETSIDTGLGGVSIDTSGGNISLTVNSTMVSLYDAAGNLVSTYEE